MSGRIHGIRGHLDSHVAPINPAVLRPQLREGQAGGIGGNQIMWLGWARHFEHFSVPVLALSLGLSLDLEVPY